MPCVYVVGVPCVYVVGVPCVCMVNVPCSSLLCVCVIFVAQVLCLALLLL